MPKLLNGIKGDSNPGSLDCESGILPLSHRAPHNKVKLVTSVKEKSVQARLYLNLKKTKVVSTEEIEEFVLDGKKVEIERDLSSSVPKLKTPVL